MKWLCFGLSPVRTVTVSSLRFRPFKGALEVVLKHCCGFAMLDSFIPYIFYIKYSSVSYSKPSFGTCDDLKLNLTCFIAA